MGDGATLYCRKCGYKFYASEGVGFLYPAVYMETVQKAKSGELGDVLKTFFEDHPTGALNAEDITLCCEKCGNLQSGQDLTMYVPKDNNPVKINHGRWSIAVPFEGAEYYTDSDFREHFTEYMKYPHKCEKCGGDMRRTYWRAALGCPQCKALLEAKDALLWD